MKTRNSRNTASAKTWALWLGVTALGALSGCADRLIEARVGAESVVVAEASQVGECESKGSSTISVMSNVLFYTRSPEAVENNLLKMARNAAMDAGGNTVVKGSSAAFGERSFDIYKCRR